MFENLKALNRSLIQTLFHSYSSAKSFAWLQTVILLHVLPRGGELSYG